jgi:DMSO/TMAO reductase YedYZ molybdopterin-dependent catalytic subunit
MRKLAIGYGALAGALLTAPLIGLLYLAHKLVGLPFLPFDFFDWATRLLPGSMVTFGIDMMIDTIRLFGAGVAGTARTAERVIAVVQIFLMGVAGGIIFFAVFRLRDTRPDVISGLAAGALVGLPMIAISIAIEGSTVQPILVVLWLSVVFLAWGAGLREIYLRVTPLPAEASADSVPATAPTVDRRQFLIRVGAATAVITVASSSLGNLLARQARQEQERELEGSVAHMAETGSGSPFPNANDPLMPAPGTRPEYTPLKDHYKVSIRTAPTVIDGDTWRLPIMGEVDNPLSLTLDDLRNNYEPQSQFVTLSCISGRVGTDLISTTMWTGARVEDILADAKPTGKAQYLFIKSGDGFYETVDLDLIASDSRIMLAYDWDGHPLPIDHGFPLRIWLPDRFGMKQPRWITEIMVVEDYTEGYWVERGWDEVARVKATSVIDTIAQDATYESNGQTMVPVGGMAFGGARGISRVEVRVDGGPWREAKLRAPLSETTWVLWRYDWPFEAGPHGFEVRCQEADGTPQIEEERGNRPSGATGIHSKHARL